MEERDLFPFCFLAAFFKALKFLVFFKAMFKAKTVRAMSMWLSGLKT